jgi:hypothetical protein
MRDALERDESATHSTLGEVGARPPGQGGAGPLGFGERSDAGRRGAKLDDKERARTSCRRAREGEGVDGAHRYFDAL